MAKENPDFEYHKSSILSESEFLEKIKKEKDNLLSALFIIHSYIEAILFDWISYCGEGKSKEISDEVMHNIERVGFLNLIQLHLLMGNISQELYAELKKFNTGRNDLVHGIRDIDFDSQKTKKGIEKNIEHGLKIYSKVFAKYQKTLDKIGKKFTLDSSKLA